MRYPSVAENFCKTPSLQKYASQNSVSKYCGLTAALHPIAAVLLKLFEGGNFGKLILRNTAAFQAAGEIMVLFFHNNGSIQAPAAAAVR